MCGILFSNLDDIKSFRQALSLIEHRGPDELNVLVKDKCVFGHARLSIIGLGVEGSQPAVSECERFTLLFNGEIYNYRDLHIRNKRIGNCPPYVRSDTQELMYHILNYGLEETLCHINGMFAIFLYDAHTQSLSIARDGGGEKPIYYYNSQDKVIVSSDLRCIKHITKHPLTVDPDAVKAYLACGYIPAPLSIYAKVKKLRAGEMVKIDLKLKEVIERKRFANINIDSNHLKDFDYQEFKQSVYGAVASRTVSDVPVAALLSGGIDSSVVAAVYQKITDQKISTFNMSFKDQIYDEGTSAENIARRIGSNHTRLYFEDFCLFSAIDELSDAYDEPFGDPSQLPTYLICKEISKDFKVCLSGDGGDEALLGYNRHLVAYYAQQILKLPSELKYILRIIISSHLRVMNLTNRTFTRQKSLITGLDRKLKKLDDVLKCKEPLEFYERSVQQHKSELFRGEFQFDKFLNSNEITELKSMDLVTATQRLDYLMYLPDCIFCKVDRASMFNSLEVRAPFLELDFLNQANTIHNNNKVLKGKGKLPLRLLAEDEIGADLFSNTKKGFGFPIGNLFRGLWKDYVHEVARKSWLVQSGYVPREYYEMLLRNVEISDNTSDLSLWNLFAFDHWALKNQL